MVRFGNDEIREGIGFVPGIWIRVRWVEAREDESAAVVDVNIVLVAWAVLAADAQQLVVAIAEAC